MSGIYDWSQDRQDRWGRRGDASFVTHYELEAVLEPIDGKLRDLHERVERNEDRLVEERAKHFAGDVLSSTLGKFTVIVLAVLTAFLLTNVLHISNPFG